MKILPCVASVLSLPLAGCVAPQPVNTANAYVRDIVIDGETLPLFRNVVSDQTVSPPIRPPDLRSGGIRQVRLHVVVGEDGAARSTHVKYANVTKGTLEATQDAVRRWRFPAIAQDGRATRYVAEVRLTYVVIITTEQTGPANVQGSYRSRTTYTVEIR